jgi:SAM-dependent methyltransferase
MPNESLRSRLAVRWDNLLEILRRQGDIPFPPLRMRTYVGPFGSIRTYRIAGVDFLGYLEELCGLEPHHAVLDIGCGCGQVAAPLTGVLDAHGSYLGFDIAQELIRWCERHIARRHRQFRFTHADLYNMRYSTAASTQAADFTFPATDAVFDVVFAKSVFTHLLPPDTVRYVAETARVLRPSGRCLLTFFLVNDQSRSGIAAGRSNLPFQPSSDGTWVKDQAVPEVAIAYEEITVRRLLREHGLRVVEPIRFGSWCGRADCYRGSFQDLVIAEPAHP